MSYSKDKFKDKFKDQFTGQMLELLVKIIDLEERTKFGNQVFAALTSNDKNEMMKVLNSLNAYIDTKYISCLDEHKARVLWEFYI